MKHEYWVFFPQRVEEIHDDHTSSSNVLHCKSQDEAWNKMIEFNGGYFEKLQYRKHNGVFGRYFTGDMWVNPAYANLSKDDIWNVLKKEDSIIIDKRTK